MKPVSIVSERNAKNKRRGKTLDAGRLLVSNYLGINYENYRYRADFSFELQIIKVFETTR
jgi:hypothetical protein